MATPTEEELRPLALHIRDIHGNVVQQGRCGQCALLSYEAQYRAENREVWEIDAVLAKYFPHPPQSRPVAVKAGRRSGKRWEAAMGYDSTEELAKFREAPLKLLGGNIMSVPADADGMLPSRLTELYGVADSAHRFSNLRPVGEADASGV